MLQTQPRDQDKCREKGSGLKLISGLAITFMEGRKLIFTIVVAIMLTTAYPLFVLGYTWSHVARSNFSGGRHGPLDAYRHTLASAVVSFTLSPRVVDGVILVMERGGKDANRMDRHNNLIGADIGARARTFSEIEPAVNAQVQRGKLNAIDPAQVTWLPPTRWQASILW